MSLTHDWQLIDGEFRCSQCGARSSTGSSSGTCMPRAVREKRTITEPVRRRPRGPCVRRGDQIVEDGIPLVHRCGCPSSEKLPIYACAIHGRCMTFAASLPPGVKRCTHCPDRESKLC